MSVTIYEVGPRDGLQNEKTVVSVRDKAEFIHRLVAAGLPVVEATSFVHPKWVPQLADAAELMTMLIEGLGDRGRQFPVLVPNERGLDRALELGVQHIAIFGSATETFARKNLNRSLDEHRHQVGGVRELGDPLRVDEAGRLDHGQAGGDETAYELALVLGRDDRLLVLEAVAGADLVDRDALGELNHRDAPRRRGGRPRAAPARRPTR